MAGRHHIVQGLPMKHFAASAVAAAEASTPRLGAEALPITRGWLPRLLSGLALTYTALAALASQAEPLAAAAERYRPLMAEEIDHSLAGARALRDALLANDLEGAQQAWIAARVGWERAEVFTSGFTELDAEIDAWPNAVTGFHAIEAKLFGAQLMDVKPETDALIFHLTDLRVKIRDTRLTAQGLLNGAAKLVYEVGESKADGGESRFSGTSLDDMRNNVDGVETVFRIVFAAEIEGRDPKLADALRTKIDQLQTLVRVPALGRLDSNKLRAESEELIVAFQTAAPLVGLDRPSLQDLVQR
jgi:iron uptake system component EfeO